MLDPKAFHLSAVSCSPVGRRVKDGASNVYIHPQNLVANDYCSSVIARTHHVFDAKSFIMLNSWSRDAEMKHLQLFVLLSKDGALRKKCSSLTSFSWFSVEGHYFYNMLSKSVSIRFTQLLVFVIQKISAKRRWCNRRSPTSLPYCPVAILV